VTIARFRVRHEQALAGLLVQSLKLCAAAGMVRLGLIALDGTKIEANAAAGLRPRPRPPGAGVAGPRGDRRGAAAAGRQQQHDGGWAVDFASWSPAAALEWRGYMTVCAISILQRNHRI
jgi:hypothetical protein